jgi:hypothetical protein
MTEDVREQTAGSEREHGSEHHDHKDLVVITVNRFKYEISHGQHTVAEIKQLASVPAADELAQVREGHDPKPLPDNGSVTIEGGEVFLSYPRDSGSS